jgi:parallel beta-helix repeat protein/predicted outer membrane repeat protein
VTANSRTTEPIIVEEQFMPIRQQSELYIRSQFSYNTKEYRYSGSGGGAICAFSSNITVNGSVFTYNNARRGGGGAIFTCCSGILQVINTTFIGNRAYDYYYRISGGATYTLGQSTIILVIQCQFINNYASGDGGGLYNERGSLTVAQNNFSSNSARSSVSGGNGSGGGIYTTGNLSTTECNFLNNIASGSGGGIYKTGSTLTTLTECNFLSNIAGGSGGATYKMGNDDIIVISRNTYNN